MLRQKEPLVRVCVNTLHMVGYEMGRKGYIWTKFPRREWRPATSQPGTGPSVPAAGA